MTRRSTNILDIVAHSNFDNKDTWIGEAKFGFEYIRSFCEELNPGSAVLEVGCGSGILMAMLSEAGASLRFEGIEPFGDGFQNLTELNSFLQENGMVIHNVGFEDYVSDKKYDLIYLVNVFEHLDSWRYFLEFVERYLTDNGVCVVLCPNYNVPYESHFGIPILINKRLTEKAFAKSIAAFEEENDCHGLWNSLNFVKLSEVKKEVGDTRLSLTINDKITEDMIDRIATDDEFRKRQRAVGSMGVMMKKLGLSKFFRLRLFQNLQPYMMIEFRLSR